MERRRSTLVACFLLALALVGGCGASEDPDPEVVLDRALTRANLAGLVADGEGGTVAVEALGYEDRILDRRLVEANPAVMTSIVDALGSSGSGLRGLVEDLEYDGTDLVSGDVVEHVSGGLETDGLASALEGAGGSDVIGLAGLDGPEKLADSLAAADFDLYAGQDDGVIRRLDLTLALDDPGNALPPTRIRFSLTPGIATPQ